MNLDVVVVAIFLFFSSTRSDERLTIFCREKPVGEQSERTEGRFNKISQICNVSSLVVTVIILKFIGTCQIMNHGNVE